MSLKPKKESWFRRRSEETIKKRSEMQNSQFATIFKPGLTEFKAQKGTNCIRYLPAPQSWDTDHYAMDVYVHYLPGGQYLCPVKNKTKWTKQGKCAACEASDIARRNGDKKESFQFSAGRRCVAWVLDRQDKGKNVEPKIYSQPAKLDTQVQGCSRIKGKTYYIDDPDVGYDVEFTKVEKGGGPQNVDYISIKIDHESSAISDNQKECDRIRDWIVDHPIPDQLVYTSPEKMEQLVGGTHEEPDEDLDTVEGEDDDEPKVKAKKRPRDESDDEDSPDDHVGDADDEDEDEEVDEADDESGDDGDEDEDSEDDEGEDGDEDGDDSDDDDGDEADEDDDEEEEPAPKRVVAMKKKKKAA